MNSTIHSTIALKHFVKRCTSVYFYLLAAKDEDTELMPNGSQGLCGSDVWYNFVIKKISKHYHLFFLQHSLALHLSTTSFLLKLSIHLFQLLGQQYSSDGWQNYLFCLFLLLLDFVSLCFNICKDSWHLISGYYMDLRLLIFLLSYSLLCYSLAYLKYRKSHYLHVSPG